MMINFCRFFSSLLFSRSESLREDGLSWFQTRGQERLSADRHTLRNEALVSTLIAESTTQEAPWFYIFSLHLSFFIWFKFMWLDVKKFYTYKVMCYFKVVIFPQNWTQAVWNSEQTLQLDPLTSIKPCGDKESV